ncbi:hypothetical protein AWB65_06289 [Caballeronia humi]|uniref:Insertion element IS150 protein InsJ-like helix-turn-helix domain-containing protein n=1 Tax=Caballeronia humi TaxID=326474 RepID=A0A158JB72_9BURK|nr:hypothetical protein AWB65_06289 [Caballeronia humi]
MDREIAKRLQWVRIYVETGHAGLVCARCGISRLTLRKWVTQYRETGEQRLQSHSQTPLNGQTGR